jgi:hypothetical protein
MNSRNRYGPRFQDKSGCRSRRRLSRPHVTLPGCWVRVGTLAHGDSCCALLELIALYLCQMRKNDMAAVRRAQRSERGSAYCVRSEEDWRDDCDPNDLNIVLEHLLTTCTEDVDLVDTACAGATSKFGDALVKPHPLLSAWRG